MKLGDYADSLDSKVKERYREIIFLTEIDPFIIRDKNFDPECFTTGTISRFCIVFGA